MKCANLSKRVGSVFVLTIVSACLATADEVELKFIVKEAQIPQTLTTFTQGKDGEERNIYFLERDDMALSQKGIILRLCENPGSGMIRQ